MQNKTLKTVCLSMLGVITTFLMLDACGSDAVDIGEGNCPDVQPSVTLSVVTTGDAAATVATSGGSGGAFPPVTNQSVTTSGGMEQVEQYETPKQDEVVSRLHACHKMTYHQLGNFLKTRGVAVPDGGLSDVRTTQTNIFGTMQTLGSVFGGSGQSCETAITDANGTNDPVCPSNEVCFCNQDDKMNQVNRSCLDVGNNSPDAADGYCVAKPATAGYLYFSGKDSLGVPRLNSRMAERDEHSTASAMKMMDIFIQAAPQIISNISNPLRAPACTLNGKNLPMFDPKDGSCVEESVSCLIGTPASEDHMLLCNLLVQKSNVNDATDVAKKRNMAVAVLLSAAHSCQ